MIPLALYISQKIQKRKIYIHLHFHGEFNLTMQAIHKFKYSCVVRAESSSNSIHAVEPQGCSFPSLLFPHFLGDQAVCIIPRATVRATQVLKHWLGNL